jgi:hypothetical protein
MALRDAVEAPCIDEGGNMRRVFSVLAVMALLAVMAVPAWAAEQFRIELSGANEVPPADPDGTGSARVSFDQTGTVCFDIRVSDVGPILFGHIHVAPAGVNGPIVVDFDIPNNGLEGCVEGDPAVLEAIRANPAGYYVNVHNADFPGGALRGQLD